MSIKQSDAPQYTYLQSVSTREPEALKQLREETARLTHFVPSTPEQGQLLHFLVTLTQAQRILELGTLTGYATAWMAMATEGSVDACDISTKFTSLGARYWHRLGVHEKIHLHIQPALKTLLPWIKQGKEYDFIYLDADKRNYLAYYEHSLSLLKKGGLLVIDNTYWHGHPAQSGIDDPATQAIRTLNAKLHHDPRIVLSALSISDGMTLVYKK
jgi:predicted O-methyltransferase YrrM